MADQPSSHQPPDNNPLPQSMEAQAYILDYVKKLSPTQLNQFASRLSVAQSHLTGQQGPGISSMNPQQQSLANIPPQPRHDTSLNPMTPQRAAIIQSQFPPGMTPQKQTIPTNPKPSQATSIPHPQQQQTPIPPSNPPSIQQQTMLVNNTSGQPLNFATVIQNLLTRVTALERPGPGWVGPHPQPQPHQPMPRIPTPPQTNTHPTPAKRTAQVVVPSRNNKKSKTSNQQINISKVRSTPQNQDEDLTNSIHNTPDSILIDILSLLITDGLCPKYIHVVCKRFYYLLKSDELWSKILDYKYFLYGNNIFPWNISENQEITTPTLKPCHGYEWPNVIHKWIYMKTYYDKAISLVDKKELRLFTNIPAIIIEPNLGIRQTYLEYGQFFRSNIKKSTVLYSQIIVNADQAYLKVVYSVPGGTYEKKAGKRKIESNNHFADIMKMILKCKNSQVFDPVISPILSGAESGEDEDNIESEEDSDNEKSEEEEDDEEKEKPKKKKTKVQETPTQIMRHYTINPEGYIIVTPKDYYSEGEVPTQKTIKVDKRTKADKLFGKDKGREARALHNYAKIRAEYSDFFSPTNLWLDRESWTNPQPRYLLSFYIKLTGLWDDSKKLLELHRPIDDSKNAKKLEGRIKWINPFTLEELTIDLQRMHKIYSHYTELRKTTK
jgi:hypothetical protein